MLQVTMHVFNIKKQNDVASHNEIASGSAKLEMFTLIVMKTGFQMKLVE